VAFGGEARSAGGTTWDSRPPAFRAAAAAADVLLDAWDHAGIGSDREAQKTLTQAYSDVSRVPVIEVIP
jgi:hypothetical protein